MRSTPRHVILKQKESNVLLTPKNILMILLLAEVLSPINRLCQFLQTRNLNFCSIDNKIDELYKQLKVQPKVLFIK